LLSDGTISESRRSCGCTGSSGRTPTQLSDLEHLTERHFQVECAAARADGAHHHVHANAPLGRGVDVGSSGAKIALEVRPGDR
jgi:hypothetical protein